MTTALGFGPAAAEACGSDRRRLKIENKKRRDALKNRMKKKAGGKGKQTVPQKT